jgi:hypothetical protein
MSIKTYAKNKSSQSWKRLAQLILTKSKSVTKEKLLPI